MRIALTGANGHLAKVLIEALLANGHELLALVRSAAARASLSQDYPSLMIKVVDYTNPEVLGEVLVEIDQVIHLVGIIKESRRNSFQAAHEMTCVALAAACKLNDIQSLIYLSIVGASLSIDNSCLRSKAKAEKILLDAIPAVKILRLPMILGAGDYASYALKQQASRSVCFGFRTASLEQPVYVADVVSLILKLLKSTLNSEVLTLAGPEVLSRADLIRRAGLILGKQPRVVSLPLFFAMSLAFLLSGLAAPPVTRAMLGVLDHDDQIDVDELCRRFDLELTPLDDILRSVLAARPMPMPMSMNRNLE